MSAAKCPRCRSDLQAYDAGQLMLGICVACAGAWLDNRGCQMALAGRLPDEVRQLIRAADARATATPGHYRDPGQAEATTATCPACAAPLSPYVTNEATQGAHIELDVCPPHGTWFDRGEAWKLLQAVEMKQLGIEVEMETAGREAAWGRREAAWSGFVAGAAPRTLRR